MTRRAVSLLLLLSLFIGVPAAAYDLGGANVLIPVAGRAAGAFGSQWRTDLVVTNLEDTAADIHVSLYEGRTGYHVTNRTIPPFGTVVLEDVIRTAFLLDSTIGMLRVHSASPDARLAARAYVYNRGSAAGEFGQGIPGVPIDALAQEHVLTGVAGGAARRTNVGVANPWPTETDVLLTMHGGDGRILASTGHTIAPLTVLQINDIFAALGVAPAPEASIRVHSSAGVYPYASIVRSDSGDAVFVVGSGVRVDAPSPAPVCSEPAALILPARGEGPQEESMVVVGSSTPKEYVLNVLAPRHGFTIDHYYDSSATFSARLTPQQIAALRCEAEVLLIRRDGVAPF